MGEGTELHDQTVLRRESRAGEGGLARAWARIRHILARSIFWSYERGSWQYDLLVLVILAFIFLSPPSWFSDRPTLQLTDLRHHPGIVEVGRGKDGWSYVVDARLIESLAPEKPEDAVREILQRRLRKPFTVKSMDVIRDRNNVILGYTVVVAH